MLPEEGLFPTTDLRLVASQRAAPPGEVVSIRIDGTDAGSLVRGKVVTIERNIDGGWEFTGAVIVGRTPDERSTWKPAGSPPYAVTAEGYLAAQPMYFDVPPIEPGDYRIRIDAAMPSHPAPSLRDRTATLYTSLLVLTTG
jgi:hypothetical protein